MVNRSKIKGTAGEAALVGALVEEGWIHAERRALHGNTDKGDVAGIPGLMIEVKNEKSYDVSGWLREVRTEQENARAEIGVCWFKLRGRTDPRDWAVVMSGQQFIDILKRLGYHPSQP